MIPSVRQGFLPDVISTDMHYDSMNAGMKNMSNVMSMFLSLGLSFPDVILRSTWNPAKVINRTDLGHLSPGVDADIAVFTIKEGKFGYQDSYERKFNGTKKIETELTIRAGTIVWNQNGLGAKMWDTDPVIFNMPN
jgi:dihydroorotase